MENYIGDVKIGGAVAGEYGGQYIAAADGEVTVDCTGFVSWDDTTVISGLKIATDSLHDTRHNLDSVTIPKGAYITFGYTATKITLSAGAGWVIRAEAF